MYRQKLGIKGMLTNEEHKLVSEGAKIARNTNQEFDESDIQLKDNILDEFWYRRKSEARRYVWMQIFSNLIF